MKPILTRRVSAIVEPHEVGDLLRAIAGCRGQPVARTALWLSGTLFQRPGNVLQLQWLKLDLEGGLWTTPSEKIKPTKRKKLNHRSGPESLKPPRRHRRTCTP